MAALEVVMGAADLEFAFGLVFSLPVSLLILFVFYIFFQPVDDNIQTKIEDLISESNEKLEVNYKFLTKYSLACSVQ